jgi:hypothetical protein
MLGMILSKQLEASKSIRKRERRLARLVSHCNSSKKTGVNRIPTREASKLARMQQRVIDAMVSQGSPLDA